VCEIRAQTLLSEFFIHHSKFPSLVENITITPSHLLACQGRPDNLVSRHYRGDTCDSQGNSLAPLCPRGGPLK
jgi:hypothetical protein